MNSGGEWKIDSGTKTVYRIVVSSELSKRYAAALEGMEMETRVGHTIFTGEVKDQSHLHGLLDRIGAMGLTLVSVESVPRESVGGK